MSREVFFPLSNELQEKLNTSSEPAIATKNKSKDQDYADALFTQWRDLHILKIAYSNDNPTYRLVGGELRIVSDDELSAEIRRQFNVSDDKAGLVLKNLKFLLSRSNRCVDPAAIKPIAFKDDKAEFAWKRLSVGKATMTSIALCDLPEFEDFVNRCGDGKRALTLWIGSLLDAQSNRAQYLHIRGDGGDGKSTLCDALNSLFGERAITITANRLREAHFGPELEGARLAIFKDENNPAFFQGSEFKRLTGESCMTVNPKYCDTRTIQIVAKVLVSSNVEIRIPDADADKRRLISIEVQKSNATPSGKWRENFIKSSERILAYCFKEYVMEKKKNPQVRHHIDPPAAKVQAAIDRNYEQFEEILQNHFMFNPSDAVLTTTVHSVFKEKLGRPLNAIDFKAIEKVLEKQGSEKTKKSGGIRYYSKLSLRTK